MASSDITLQSLDAKIEALKGSVTQHDKVLLGNGREGLVQTVARLEATVNSIQNTAEKMENNAKTFGESLTKSLARLETSAGKSENHIKSIAKWAGSLSKRIKDLEALLKPMLDWKKEVIIRIGTVLATCGIIGATFWWLVENKDKVREIFK